MTGHPYRTPASPPELSEDEEPESEEAKAFLAAYLMLLIHLMFGTQEDER